MPQTNRKLGREFANLWTASTVNGGMLAGAALGGLAATCLGLTAPFWLGFTAMTAVSAVLWGALNNRDIRAGREPGLTDSGEEAVRPRATA